MPTKPKKKTARKVSYLTATEAEAALKKIRGEETPGVKMAREARKRCSNMTAEEREKLTHRALELIHKQGKESIWHSGDIVRLADKYLIGPSSSWEAVVLDTVPTPMTNGRTIPFLFLQGISTTGVPWRATVPAFMLVKAPSQP